MTTLQINSILQKEEAGDVLFTVAHAQNTIKKLLQNKDDQWTPAQFAEFFRVMAAENLLNFYNTHTPKGYETALDRWKDAEKSAQKAYREEHLI